MLGISFTAFSNKQVDSSSTKIIARIINLLDTTQILANLGK